MTYLHQYDFPIGTTAGANAYSLPVIDSLTNILSVNATFFPGSTIYFQEILDIFSQIDTDQDYLVDVDKRWFDPKVYYGTYQLASLLDGIEPEAEGGQGFLTNFHHKIKRYSAYTVVPSPNSPENKFGSLRIDNCNFYTAEAEFVFGGVGIKVATPVTSSGIFSGDVSQVALPLNPAKYYQFFNEVGLFHNPGCSPVRLEHRVASINAVTILGQDFAPSTCQTVQPTNACSSAFIQDLSIDSRFFNVPSYRFSSQNPPPAGRYYWDNNIDCQSAKGQGCFAQPYTCPDGSDAGIVYWDFPGA